jgi:hypothetical protein
MNTKRSQSILFVPVLLLMLIMAACQPQAQPLAGPDPTAVAASVEAYFSETATQPATAAPTPEPVMTDEPKTIDMGSTGLRQLNSRVHAAGAALLPVDAVGFMADLAH